VKSSIPASPDTAGEIVKTTGDGLLLEFASVVDAVHCVRQVQTAIEEKTADASEYRRIVFRVGVNIAARLQEIAASRWSLRVESRARRNP
jgi:class 3 adenylate cyclase